MIFDQVSKFFEHAYPLVLISFVNILSHFRNQNRDHEMRGNCLFSERKLQTLSEIPLNTNYVNDLVNELTRGISFL